MKKVLTIKGTHCSSCKTLIEDVSRDISGISNCVVDFKTGRTEIEHNATVDWNEFKKEIEALGDYKVEL